MTIKVVSLNLSKPWNTSNNAWNIVNEALSPHYNKAQWTFETIPATVSLFFTTYNSSPGAGSSNWGTFDMWLWPALTSVGGNSQYHLNFGANVLFCSHEKHTCGCLAYVGTEPATSALGARRTNLLSHRAGPLMFLIIEPGPGPAQQDPASKCLLNFCTLGTF